MIRLHDRTGLYLTESDLVCIAKNKEWALGDLLSYYTNEVKVARVIEELYDNGDISRWATDNRCTEKCIERQLLKEYDSVAVFQVHSYLNNAAVKVVVKLLNGNVLHLQLGIVPDNYQALEKRIYKLEKLLLK